MIYREPLTIFTDQSFFKILSDEGLDKTQFLSSEETKNQLFNLYDRVINNSLIPQLKEIADKGCRKKISHLIFVN